MKKVIKLDKLKIVVNEKYITNINEDVFTTIIKNGQIVKYRYEQQVPYLLYIEKDIVKQELVIEFSGKILEDKYPLLINKDTIKICLDNINKLAICHINVPEVLQNSVVVKADVSHDICCGSYQQLISTLKTSVKNHNKYLSRVIHGTFVIEKNVVSRSRKVRMTIYDKAAEMQLKANQEYLDRLSNRDEVAEYYKDKVRFELNLNSMEQIRKHLNIHDTMLYNVLHAEANPIVEFIDKAFVLEDPAPIDMKLRDIERLALLESVDRDVTKLEMIVRKHSSPKSHISQLMQPYRNLLKTIEQKGENYLLSIRNVLLVEIFLAFIVSI